MEANMFIWTTNLSGISSTEEGTHRRVIVVCKYHGPSGQLEIWRTHCANHRSRCTGSMARIFAFLSSLPRFDPTGLRNVTIDARSLKLPSKKMNWQSDTIWRSWKRGPHLKMQLMRLQEFLLAFLLGFRTSYQMQPCHYLLAMHFWVWKKNVLLPGFQNASLMATVSNAATPAEPPPLSTRSYPLFPGLQWRDGFGGCPILQQMNHLEIHRSTLFE